MKNFGRSWIRSARATVPERVPSLVRTSFLPRTRRRRSERWVVGAHHGADVPERSSSVEPPKLVRCSRRWRASASSSPAWWRRCSGSFEFHRVPLGSSCSTCSRSWRSSAGRCSGRTRSHKVRHRRVPGDIGSEHRHLATRPPFSANLAGCGYRSFAIGAVIATLLLAGILRWHSSVQASRARLSDIPIFGQSLLTEPETMTES